MADFLDELGAFLVSESVVTAVGGTTGTPLFLGYLPDKPDACLSVRPTPGRAPTKEWGSAGVRFEHPNAQIVARGVKDDFETPFSLAISAHNALSKVQAGDTYGTLSSTNYLEVTPLQFPSGVLGKDEQGRYRISFNIAIDKEPS